MFKGLSRVGIEEMFTMDENTKGTRDHCLKLRKTRCTRDITRHFSSNRVVNRWNLLDQQTVDAHSLNAFKNRLSWQPTTGCTGLLHATSPLSPIGLAGGGPAGEAAQGRSRTQFITAFSVHFNIACNFVVFHFASTVVCMVD